MAIRESLGDTLGLISLYTNLGILYKNALRYDSAQYYYDLIEPLLDKAPERRLEFYTNQGVLYRRQKKYGQAEEFFQKALAEAQRSKNANEIGDTWYNLGELAIERGDVQTGKQALLKTLSLSEYTQSTFQLWEVHRSLSKAYHKQGLTDSAFYHLTESVTYGDSVYALERVAATEEVAARYETEKKEQAIALLNQENALQESQITNQALRLQRNSFLVVALLVLLGGVVAAAVYLRSRQNQREQAALATQQTQLREAQTQAIIESQEQERTRFATDLHDGLGQLITALNLNLQKLTIDHSEHDQAPPLLANSKALLAELHQEVRNIAFNMMPPILVKEGLVPALRQFIYRINRAQGPTLHLHTYGLPERFSETEATALYRIIQELISNSIRYAQPQRIDISLTGHEDEMVLTVEDDGKGFSVDTFRNSQGSGWRNVNFRVHLLKGELTIESQPGQQGTTTLIAWPSHANTGTDLQNTDPSVLADDRSG
ncbi:MAG: ATP-binding protein [Bacteroidota bacterium]